MSFDVGDGRAIIVLIFFFIATMIARAYNYATVMYVLFVVFLILFVMYANKLYHREIKKDYFSRYDKIDVPDEDETDNDENIDTDLDDVLQEHNEVLVEHNEDAKKVQTDDKQSTDKE